MNLVEIIHNQVGNQMVGQISYLIGEDSTKTQTALKAALPALLGGMMNKASTPEGANDLGKILAKLNDNAIASIPGLLASGKADSLAQQGSSMLSTLLGDESVSELSAGVANFSGINEAASDKLLGVLGPIAMGNMKQNLMQEGGISATNISSVLLAQKDSLLSEIPEGLSSHFSSSAGFLSNLKPNIGASLEDSSAAATNSLDSVTDGLESSADSFADVFSEPQVLPDLTGMSEAGLDAVSDIGDQSQAFAVDAFEETQHVADAGMDDLNDASANVAAQFDDGFEESKDFAAEFTNEAANFSEDAIEGSVSFIGDGVGKANDMASQAASGLSDLGASGIESLSDLGQKGLDGLGDAAEHGRNLVSGGVDHVSDAVSDSLTSAKDVTSSSWDAATDMAGKAKDSVTDITQEVSSTKLKYGRILIPALIAAVAILLILNLFR